MRIGSIVVLAFGRYPTGAVLAATLLTLYAIPFLLFVYRLDLFEREPATMVGAAFAWGGLVATSLALSGNQALFDLTVQAGEPRTGRPLGSRPRRARRSRRRSRCSAWSCWC